MLTEPILSHESESPFSVVPTVLKLAGQVTSDLADSRARLVLYEPAHSDSITYLVDTIDRHHIGTESCPEISIQQQIRYHHRTVSTCRRSPGKQEGVGSIPAEAWNFILIYLRF
ncbi:hypothetical protein M8J77_014682 [Diaphorina citri]|nr:hypothetical protein M8J77_014682 [Diaphorina citri]